MGACASRFEVLKDGANPPPPPMAPPVGDEFTNRLSFDHLLEKNEGERVLFEREGKSSELVEGNCQENGSLKSLQPVDDLVKTQVEKTLLIAEGLMCKTSEEIKTDAKSEESEAIPRNVEQKEVEITGKDLNPVKTENVSAQERI